MFKILVRFCIYFSLTLAISKGNDVQILEAENSVVVTAAPASVTTSNGDRSKRQFVGGEVLYMTSSVCLTSRGTFGRCLSFQQCYPFFKLPEFSQYENWILSMQETCSYVASSGKQEAGICCNNQGYYNNLFHYAPDFPPPGPQAKQFPPFLDVNPIPANWPPPIPTHPPDHTIPPLPTHPPSTQYYPLPTTSAPTVGTSTSKPVSIQWPPPLPTHPTRPTTYPTPLWTASTPITDVEEDAGVVPQWNVSECGVKNGYQDQERIVGGRPAENGEWPWMAAILTNGRLFCGGSLIDNSHILTAAHCVAHMNPWDVARLRINLGDYNIKSKGDGQHIERKVKKVVRHRGFDPQTLYHDIALLTLDSPVNFTKNIRPICLPQAKAGYSGKMATVIGWGSLAEMGPTSQILREVNIPVWTNEDCKGKYGSAAPGGIVETFLCAGKAGQDSCSGDSGGPLMVSDGKWQQVGVVSWGIGCGKGQYPGVYTRITAYMSWIGKNLNI